ncbi:unnamed protein product [Prorocentrum cordatum]|uniref:C2 domain-containing protein n=1 Tax=Prorocentrum cordatum TaxID=2364126 RepID=A0ABN9TLS4_9DINO|nr:unnamed protein product [Polarella glacialis]
MEGTSVAAAEDVLGNLSADVKILAAKGLNNRDWLGKSDPYCELFVGGVSRGQTEVRWNNLSPQWDKGSITIRGLRPGDEVEFKVWDDDRLLPGMSQERNRESLGSCKLPLPAAGEKKDEWLQVEGAAEEVGDGEPPHLHVAVEVRSDAATGPMTEPNADAKTIAKLAAEDVPGNLSVDVKILAAKGLKNRDWMGKSDPWRIVSCLLVA